MSDLRAALELEPNNSNTQAALGYALWDSGDIAQSREMLEQAHKGLPDDPALIRQLAYVNQRLDDMPATRHNVPAAVSDLRAALELEPNNSNTQAALGYALWDSGDIAQSREMLELAHKGLPDDPALIRQLAYVNQRLDDMPATQHYARLVIDDIDNQALMPCGIAVISHSRGKCSNWRIKGYRTIRHLSDNWPT